MKDASVREVAAGKFALEGAVVFSTARELLDEGNQLFDGASSATIDLSGITQLDSAALALIIEWLRQADHAKRSLKLTGIPEKLLAIARLTGVEDIIAA